MRALTEWRLAAGLDVVWEALADPSDWPLWWPGLLGVETLEPGDALGVGAVRRFTWRGLLPYRLGFIMRTTAIEPRKLAAGRALGDLNGTGQWRFTREAGVTVVRYAWLVRLDPLWLRFLDASGGPLLSWNHDLVMAWGGRGLAKRLGVRLEGMRFSRLPVETPPDHPFGRGDA